MSRILNNERGGVSILVISFIAMTFCIIIMAVVVDYVLLFTQTKKLKNDLNRAIHAATISIDKKELSQGFFKLDTITPNISAQDMFYKYLRMNIKLDNNNRALANSKLPINSKVNIDELVYVDYETGKIENLNTKPSACTYDSTISKVNCTVIINAGTKKEIKRTVNQTVIGPSIVAIIDTEYNGFGILSHEPLLIPAVQEVIFHKR